MKNILTKLRARPFFIILIVAFAILSGCGPEQKEIVQQYGTGEVSRRHTEIDGKKEGEMTEYYKDGKIKGVRLFKHDVQVGKATFYYPGGQLKEVQYYEDGKMNGGDTVFYESGKPEFLRTFNHGVLDGYLRKWAEDGTVIYEAKYANDTLVEVKGQALHPDSLHLK